MPQTYEVRQLPVWPEIEQIRVESRGSRRKFWISIEGEPNLWLLKFPRPNTGEHWAEKIAAEVGKLIGVDCARVELTNCDGELATICESFDPTNWDELYEYVVYEDELIDDDYPVPRDIVWSTNVEGLDIEGSMFLPGCEVLAAKFADYDTSREVRFRQKEHNVENIVAAVKAIVEGKADEALRDQEGVLASLASFAILDGLIGNTDRHHENWTLKLEFSDGVAAVSAAPSYDHASSLGRELSDEDRKGRIEANSVLAYLQRGRGGVFWDANQRRAPAPLVLAQLLCQRWPKYTRRTLDAIEAVDDNEFRTIVDRIPSEFMSKSAKDFTYEVMVASKAELLRNAE